jgi:hypothetical protein
MQKLLGEKMDMNTVVEKIRIAAKYTEIEPVNADPVAPIRIDDIHPLPVKLPEQKSIWE